MHSIILTSNFEESNNKSFSFLRQRKISAADPDCFGFHSDSDFSISGANSKNKLDIPYRLFDAFF